MIGRLRGVIAEKSAGQLVLDVGGVGYVVHCAERTIASLPAIGQEAILHTDLIVREDLMQLMGFASKAEREWYWLLTSVQGVGAKAALAILNTLSTRQLARALTIGDVNSVKAANGVGPKLAARICNELKDKAAKLMGQISDDPVVEEFLGEAPTPAEVAERGGAPINFDAPPASYEAEAISALVNLGYDHVYAAQTIGALSVEHQTLDILIKAALKHMAKNAGGGR